MRDYLFENISAGDLETIMQKERESDYLIVDVRSEQEYQRGHIPGARLMPLPEMESSLSALPPDRKIVFVCRSGARSRMASMLAAEAGIHTAGVYNVEGGMLAWGGYALKDFPRVHIFKIAENTAEILTTAINLEKGAFRFYKHTKDHYPDMELHETASQLAKAEKAHAKAVYGLLQKIDPQVEAFETLYENMPGDILEGGADLETQLEMLSKSDESICMRFFEIALEIEYAAYDLYRTIAENSTDESTREFLLKIAEMEKSHMRQLTKASQYCP